MSKEQLRPLPSIVERIKGAGKYLGVSKAEIEIEITRCFETKDAQGLQEMFTAYRDWELRGASEKGSKEAQEETCARAMSNFDFVAKIADSNIITKKDLESSLIMATENSFIIGPIRQFYRDTVGYHPQTSNSTLN